MQSEMKLTKHDASVTSASLELHEPLVIKHEQGIWPIGAREWRYALTHRGVPQRYESVHC